MFPTGVGMNRAARKDLPETVNVPHRRGDEPVKSIDGDILILCSPQAWG